VKKKKLCDEQRHTRKGKSEHQTSIKNLGKPDEVLPTERMSKEIYDNFQEDEKEYYGRLAFENKQNCLSKIELEKKVKNRGQMFEEFSISTICKIFQIPCNVHRLYFKECFHIFIKISTIKLMF
jgi:hypothetical protein